MEEDFNEHELEERLYAMLHYVDETQANVVSKQPYVCPNIDTTPRSTLRRYWRTSGDNHNPYQKINTPKDTPTSENNKTTALSHPDKETKPKNETTPAPPHVDLSIFQSPVPKNIETIVIIENDDQKVIELEPSDEDEVIEVALPPKPTITIESSDDEELTALPESTVKEKSDPKVNKGNNHERDVSASPVPSVVSSVSDEFIRGDCIALNISSRHPDNHSFDFSLHGNDLLDHSTPSAKKKKKKSTNRTTSTPVISLMTPEKSTPSTDGCFATPKSKAKNKKQKMKSYTITERSIPSADVYDSDSNQSIDIHKNQSYSVTDKSVPSADVYESDSSETVKDNNKPTQDKPNDSTYVCSSDSSICLEQQDNTQKTVTPTAKSTSTLNSTKQTEISWQHNYSSEVVDLTADYVTLDATGIEENIVMGNVTGFIESDDYNDASNEPDLRTNGVLIFGSTKVPAILYEDLDFDYLKGKDYRYNRRRYSLSTLRAEMEKFYNESWGGENFNHRELQKSMSKDKNLWMIDPKDRMPTPMKRKTTCNYCNRVGHRDDTCRMKPPVCVMCGSTGHYEPRCPQKICVNCGSPNYMYSTMCRNCSTWNRIKCAECGQFGHPMTHCPDTWRRYHNTINENSELEEMHQSKKNHQLFCSGCTRRGHLVHSCRISLPFSGLPINSPFVNTYCPIYPTNNPNTVLDNSQNTENDFSQDINFDDPPHKNDRNKRMSKSPTVHETHVNKRRNVSTSDAIDEIGNSKNHLNTGHQRKTSFNREMTEAKTTNDRRTVSESNTSQTSFVSSNVSSDKALDFISITSNNHDKKGQVIQDNEVSDTSDVVTSSRIYITNDLFDKVTSPEGQDWLKSMMEKHCVDVQNNDKLFIHVKGKLTNQEAFQNELRDWFNNHENNNSKCSDADLSIESDPDQILSNNIPKNRNNVLRQLSKAFESLKEDIGDPNSLFKELTYLKNHHQKLLNQKVISPAQVSNSRQHINEKLKKLNMVLLGQAGLADGSDHIKELYALQEKVTNFRQKNISIHLRKAIGQHYHCIFTAMPRDDYSDLIQKYYVTRLPPTKLKKKKKKEKSFKMSPKTIQHKNFASPNHQKNCKIVIGDDENGEIGKKFKPKNDKIAERTKNKLVFYHRRLMNSHTTDAGFKKTRQQLVRRLHTQIASLGHNPNTSSKTLKKMKKLQHQVQLFLTNV